MMHRKSKVGLASLMNASFFEHESDGGEGDEDDVEDILLCAYLLEKSKQAQAQKQELSCCADTLGSNEDTTATASLTSEESREEKALKGVSSSSGRQMAIKKIKSHVTAASCEIIEQTSLKRTSSKGGKSLPTGKQIGHERSSEKPFLKKTSSKGNKTYAEKKERSPREVDEGKKSLKKNSSRGSLTKKKSSLRRKTSFASPSENSGDTARRRRWTSSSYHHAIQTAEQNDDDCSINSFYDEALKLDEGLGLCVADKDSHEAPESSCQQRQTTRRERRSSIATNGVSGGPEAGRGDSHDRRSSIAVGEVRRHGVLSASSDRYTTASAGLRRVTLKPKLHGRASLDKDLRNLSQILNQCNDLGRESASVSLKSVHKRTPAASQNTSHETAPTPVQLRVSDALEEAEGDQKDALQRLISNMKERRVSSAPLVDDSDGDDGADHDALAGVQESILRSANLAAPTSLARRRVSKGKMKVRTV